MVDNNAPEIPLVVDPKMTNETVIPESILATTVTVDALGVIVPNVEVPTLRTLTLGEPIEGREYIVRNKHTVTVSKYSNGIAVIDPYSFAGPSFVIESSDDDVIDAAIEGSDQIPK